MCVITNFNVSFTGVAFLNGEIKKGSSVEVIKQIFVSLCTAYKIETEPVCNGFFDVFAPDLLPAYALSKLGRLSNVICLQDRMWNEVIDARPFNYLSLI